MEQGFTATTRSITVTVQSFYLEDQSEPDEDKYVWAYTVRIENKGQQTVQLLSRRWKIIDDRGRVIEVEGPGVVGEQPVLEPGDVFEYTSGTPLETPSGFMQGTYTMVELTSGDRFEAEIPVFSLDSPGSEIRLH